MTRRISAVAVCRSSASCVSLNRRTFSIAITAWSAKVCSSSIWCAAEAPGLAPGDGEHADRRAVAPQRHAEHMLRKPRARATSRALQPVDSGFGPRCRSTHTVLAGDGSRAVTGTAVQRHREHLLHGGVALRRRRRERRRCASLAVEAKRQTAVECPSSSTVARWRRSRRTPAARRSGEAAMTLQDLGGRGLPLERLLGLVEQANVLDRDHGLVGEGLDQLDLAHRRSARHRASRPGSRRPARRPSASARPSRAATSRGGERVVVRRVGERVVERLARCPTG